MLPGKPTKDPYNKINNHDTLEKIQKHPMGVGVKFLLPTCFHVDENSQKILRIEDEIL